MHVTVFRDFFFYTVSFHDYMPKFYGVVNKFAHSLQTTIHIVAFNYEHKPSPKAGPVVMAAITPASSSDFIL
jgi:hypothetical protein